MERDTGFNPNEENARQGLNTGRSATAAASTTQPSDRERSIEKSRDIGGHTTNDTRRSSQSLIRGATVNPFLLMQRMADDMDQLFDNFGFPRLGLGLSPAISSRIDHDPWHDITSTKHAAWTPQVETFRRGEKLVVRADLPGLRKEDVKVEVADGVLAISGERRDELEDNSDGFYRTERHYGQFYRAVSLPDGATGEQCEAHFKDGVLEITLLAPKEVERKAKQIPVH
jgi:HSP20 family protein